jgi:polyferredoxin
MGYPKGLIRYTTQNALEGKPSSVTRARILVYGAILVGVCVALVISVLLRVPLALDVLRDRSALYRETVDDDIENVYTLKVMNMDSMPHAYRLDVGGIAGIRALYNPADFEIRSGEVREAVVRLVVPEDALAERSSTVEFKLAATDKPSIVVSETSRFLGPRKED